jgi:DNA-directed RNA polymerase specialized sigma24 family protein
MTAFSTTRWSLVRRATHPGPEGRRALGELIVLYEPALRAQLARWRVPGADGDDLYQAFVQRMLEDDLLRKADAELGSFRAYLATALRRFAANALRAATADKRGGGQVPGGEAELDVVVSPEPEPDRQFDADWAGLVLARVTRALREEAAQRGKEELFDALEPFLAEDAQRDDYVAIGVRFGSNANAIGVAVHRLRARLRELLRREVLETVDDTEALSRELQALRDALRG